jgi:hypothetical protein
MAILPLFRRRHTAHLVAFAALGLFGLALAFGALPAAAKAIKAPGSRISITVPDGFEISKLFSGFLHPNARASIVIAELPTTQYDQIVQGMSDEALAKKGIQEVKRGKLERSDEHHFMTGRQSARGMEVAKFILLIKDAKGVGVITANVPKTAIEDGDLTHNDVRKALTTAVLTDETAPIIKQFTLPDTGAFKEAGKIMGSAVLYSLDGVLAPKELGKTRSVLIISPSIDRMDISNIDLKAFSERALKSLGGFDNLTPQPASVVTINGLTGVRQSAGAVSQSSAAPVSLDQVILIRRSGGYFRLLAILRDDEAPMLKDDIDRIFKGFKVVDEGSAN